MDGVDEPAPPPPPQARTSIRSGHLMRYKSRTSSRALDSPRDRATASRHHHDRKSSRRLHAGSDTVGTMGRIAPAITPCGRPRTASACQSGGVGDHASGAAVTGQAASTSQMGRFETEVMTEAKNLAALTDLSGQWIDRVHARRPVRGIVLDMDSSVSPTYGEQEGSAYNGHFGCTCYHPLFVFNQFGDLERCALRPGNVHSAEGWRDVLEPVIARYRTTMKRRYFRADAGFASPEVYELLEAEGYAYVIRLPANAVLQRKIAHLLTRPVGRPPHEVRRCRVGGGRA